MLNDNRITRHIAGVREKFNALTPEQQDDLEAKMAVTFEEHFAFQNAQARAHAIGKLTTDEAQVVYVALGEVGSHANGGWAAGTDTPTKVSVTCLMGQLL